MVEKGMHKATISADKIGLSSGVYIVNLRTQDQNKRLKLLLAN